MALVELIFGWFGLPDFYLENLKYRDDYFDGS